MLSLSKHLYRTVERGWLTLLCLLSVAAGRAQTYTITTLDGNTTTISIQDNTAAASTSTPLVVYCSTDKLVLPNYWAAREVKILNKQFLQISYSERAGSGIGIGNTLLLCISYGKLRQAMHISSYFYDLGYDTITTRSTLLLLDKANTAHAISYDTLEFKRNPLRDSTAARKSSVVKSVIKFDSVQRVFCNYQKEINATLSNRRCYFEDNRAAKRHFHGTVPAFQLDGREYIFIGNRWYCKSGANKEYFVID